MQFLAAGPPTPSNPSDLSNVRVTLDAGHGAMNSGKLLSFTYQGKTRRMVEKVYNCDMVARTAEKLRARGIFVKTTTIGKCLDEPSEGTLLNAAPLSEDMFLATTGAVVRYTPDALGERLRVAREEADSGLLSINVSIHHDFAHEEAVSGAYTIVSDTHEASALGWFIVRKLSEVGPVHPVCGSTVVVNDTCKHLDDLYLLRVAPWYGLSWVLAELGNMRNRADRDCMMSAKCRDEKAESLVAAIIEFAVYRQGVDM